jgi:hypothetical protein
MNHSQIPEQEVARYWDDNANLWTDHVRKGWDAHREYFNNPAFFEFIGDLSGKAVLDAGCAVAGSRRYFLVCARCEVGSKSDDEKKRVGRVFRRTRTGLHG